MCRTFGVFLRKSELKGTVPRDFRLGFFFMNQFPPRTWVYHYVTAISNFLENLRRYSRLKVHHRCRWHRWQMEKIFNEKKFNYFVWTPLGSRVNIYINFCRQFHFKVSAAWYCSHYLPLANLPPVLLIPVAICHRRRWHRWQIWTIPAQIATGINNTSENGGKTRSKKSRDTVPLNPCCSSRRQRR